MKLLSAIAILFFSFFLMTCSSIQTNNSYDNSYDFTAFNTYKISKDLPARPDGVQMPSATYSLIKSAIDLEMTKKGIGKNEKLAEIGITWHTALNDEVYETADNVSSWENSFESNEKEMLIIDILDLKSGKVVWRGWAKNVLNTENLEERINEAVKEILVEFPPKSIPTGN